MRSFEVVLCGKEVLCAVEVLLCSAQWLSVVISSIGSDV